MQYLFLPSYLTHCEQEVRLEYHSKGHHYAKVYTLVTALRNLRVRTVVPCRTLLTGGASEEQDTEPTTLIESKDGTADSILQLCMTREAFPLQFFRP